MQNFKPDFYEKIFHSLDTNAVLMRVESNGKYFPIWCSKEFTEMMEGTAEEFIELESGGTMNSIHPDDRAEVAFLFRNHTTRTGTNSLNVRKRTIKGNWLWVNIHYSFVEEDNIWYAYCLYFDITAIKENERQAKNMYEGIRNELENIYGDSLITLRFNLTKGIVEDCRGRGLYENDKRGMKISDNLSHRAEKFPLDRDKKKFRRGFSEKKLLLAYKNGITNLSDIFFSNLQDGSKSFVEYGVTLSKNPSTGDVMAFITERECNNEMVNETILHKALVEQYDMITYIVDGNYGVVIGDAEKITRGSIFPKKRNGNYAQYVEEQVKPVLSGTDTEKKKFLEQLNLKRIERSLANSEPYEVNIACHIDGEIFHKRFVFYVVDKDAKFYILLKSDTTELQRAQIKRNEQLREALEVAKQANVAKTAFLSSMSHEMRTPMNAIIGLDSIALREPNLSEKTREHLTKIGESARHLLSLINDILDMSRIESGRMVLKSEEFSFSTLIEQVNTMFGAQCANKGLTYDCHVIGNIEEFYIGDSVKLKQVLINILGNAVKFTPAPGKITFTIEKIARYENKTTLRFIIKDTGIGMDEDYLPKIFEVFSQEDSTSNNAYGGTGLGMPITKNIVDMMNGKISVTSKKGVGSEFTVNLTLRRSDKSRANVKGISAKDLKVLVVDDDAIACKHAKLILEDLGIAADTTLSGMEAIDMVKLHRARQEAYNLILVDWRMPELDGIEVTRRIREIIGDESAIIILTAYSWEEVIDEAVAAGVDRFMAKPLFAAAVMDEFSQAIEQKKISNKSEEPIDLTGKRILLAEDMFVNAEIMKEILKMWDMKVDHGENGAQVVEMFEKSPTNYYDAVLMDIRMPVMDGLTAAEKIRALNRDDAKTVPIIALTANAFDEDVQRSLQAGMNAHLTKPVEPEHLYKTLAEFISMRNA